MAEGDRLRQAGPGRLSVVHVAPLPPSPVQVPTEGGVRLDPLVFMEAAERWLESQVDGIDGAEVVVLSDDDPPGAVCAWAAEAGVDLLVLAPHRNALERALLGSFAAHVTEHAPCEVLVVRPAAA